MLKRSIIFSLCFLTLAVTRPALAGYEYNVAPNSGTMVVIIPDEKPQIFPRDFYGIRALRDPNFPATNLTLRFFSLGNVTGCAKMTESSTNTSAKKNEILLKPKNSELDLKHEKARYGHHDCKTELNESFFDLPLNASELIRDKIKKIKMKIPGADPVNLNVDATQSKISFSSRLTPQLGGPGITVKMDYWLYPPRTVILSVPSAKTGKNVIPAITEFAVKQGYIPLDKVIPGFRLSENETNYYFFLDTKGELRERIKNTEDSIVVGKIQTTQTVFGPNGPIEESLPLDIHASIPGQDQ